MMLKSLGVFVVVVLFVVVVVVFPHFSLAKLRVDK